MASGRWYEFYCVSCQWKGTRYRNVKKCPRCRSALTRGSKAHPAIVETGLIDHATDEMLLKCPACGKISILEGFDVLGADDDCVFCTECHQELALV